MSQINKKALAFDFLDDSLFKVKRKKKQNITEDIF